MLVVVDTNIVVSAFWSKNGKPAEIIRLIQNRIITPCYDSRILEEYEEVLSRAKFGFDEWEINDFLSQIKHDGISIVAQNIDISFVDEDDKKFYEVAKTCKALLITGNMKHFPTDSIIISPAEFLDYYQKGGGSI